MRTLVLVGMLALATPAVGQTAPATPAPKPATAPAAATPAQQAPAKPAPTAPPTAAGAPVPSGVPKPTVASPATPTATTAPKPAAAPAQPAAKSNIVIEVTNARGLGLSNVRVELSGPVPRDGTTDASGFVRFLGLRAGTYRVRFSGDDVLTLEKEVTVAASRTTETEATLTPAPPKAEPPPPPAPQPPPPPAPAAPVVGPAGKPQAKDLLAREKLGKGQTRLETLLACSGNTRSTLLQLAEDQPRRIYDGAEVVLYVLTGEAGITMGSAEGVIAQGGFVSIPRATPFTLKRRGNKMLEALVVLAGEPCAEAQ